MSASWVRFGGVLAAVGALVVGASWWPGPAAPADRGGTIRAPMDSTLLVCPQPRAGAADRASVAALAASGPLPSAGTDAPGRLTLSAGAEAGAGRSPTGRPRAAVDRRDRLVVYGVPAKVRGPVVVRATGGLAPGATAGQRSRATRGEVRGLAEARCVAPASDFWFVGAGSQVGRHDRLYLTNSEATPATVDLALFDEDGPVSPEERRAVTVEPHGQVVLRLAELAPTSKRLAVAVHVRTGQVAAAVRDAWSRDGEPAGLDWLPAAAPPARRQVVPGVPAHGDGVLTVAVPTEHAAVVEVSVLGADGTFRPATGGQLQLPPGSVAELSLRSALGPEAGAIRVESDVPVVAGVRVESGGRLPDLSHVAATAALRGPAVVPATPVRRGTRATLLLTNGGAEPTAAGIRLLASDGRQLRSTSVQLPPGRTVSTTLTPPKGSGSRYAVVVTPDRGGVVYGARLLTESTGQGRLLSEWPLVTAATTQLRPVVRPGLAAP